MKRLVISATVLLTMVGLTAVLVAGAGGGKGLKRILTFQSMYGVDGPFLGETNAIRGVAGDDLPWVVDSTTGRLDSFGHLVVKVKGLVFSDDPKVPPELQGINDEPAFRVILNCLSEDEMDNVITVNTISEPFPATTTGDCTINTTIDVPNPCVTPILFVVGETEERWFAVTGIEIGKDE